MKKVIFEPQPTEENFEFSQSMCGFKMDVLCTMADYAKEWDRIERIEKLKIDYLRADDVIRVNIQVTIKPEHSVDTFPSDDEIWREACYKDLYCEVDPETMTQIIYGEVETDYCKLNGVDIAHTIHTFSLD